MGFIRFLVWTTMCIALGIFIGTFEVDGKTPAQHFQTIMKSAPKVPRLDGTVDKVKKLASEVTRDAPTEQHSDADRDAVNALVAKRASK